MKSKLTIILNKETIESAKSYAKNNQISLSNLIENYLNSLPKKNIKRTKISPLVESLTGILQHDAHVNYKTEYNEYLSRKYS